MCTPRRNLPVSNPQPPSPTTITDISHPSPLIHSLKPPMFTTANPDVPDAVARFPGRNVGGGVGNCWGLSFSFENDRIGVAVEIGRDLPRMGR